MKTIKNETLQYYCNCNICDPDIIKFIIKGLDSHFLKCCSEKMKRDLEKTKSKVSK